MNRKQFLSLLAALIIVGAAGVAVFNRDEASWSGAADQRVGQNLLKDFAVNDVAAITIKSARGELNLQRDDNRWQVRERGNYPASFTAIGDMLLKLRELKVVQAEAISAEQRGQLELIAPGGGEKTGVQVEFKDKAGKALAGLLLGKPYLRKGGPGEQGYPAGRYVMLAGDDKSLALVNDPLAELEPKPEAFIAKEFAKPDKLKSIALTLPDGNAQWKLTRETESANWQLADAKPEETFDHNKATMIANALGNMGITDVLADPKPADTGLDKPSVVTAETFDGLTYTMRIGSDGPDNSRHLAIELTGEPTHVPRKPAADEKPEDREKLDKADAEQFKKHQERIQREQRLKAWVFLAPKWTLDALVKERAQLMVEKPAAQ